VKRLGVSAKRAVRYALGLRNPRSYWIATVSAIVVSIATAIWLLPLFDDSAEELTADLTDLIANPAGTSAEAVISAASNPLPNAGFPHGRGISRADFPHGYRFRGAPRPTFDSSLEGPSSEFADERHFLRTCFLNREIDGCLTRSDDPPLGPLEVAPGDELLISALVNNNADPTGNQGGEGPAVARNSRILFGFPNYRGQVLHLTAYVYADNAIVDEHRRVLGTISDNLGFQSVTGKPIELRYRRDARLLQARHRISEEDPSAGFVYQSWLLTGDQQQMMFTGDRRLVLGNAEADPALGLPIGSTGSFDPSNVVGEEPSHRLDFFGGDRYHVFVQFKVRVAGRW
jgi:hypothetical protein